MEILLERKNDKVWFRGTNSSGNHIDLDGSEAAGGEGKGVRPTEAVLMAVASCSSVDVVLILSRQRQQLKDIRVKARAERSGGTPDVFTSIHLHFFLYGSIDPEKAARAISLSIEKYCTVAHMLRQDIPVNWTFEILPSDEA